METVYEVPDEDREKLKEPMGDVLKDRDRIGRRLSDVEGQVILVGDYVSLNFESFDPDVSVVDCKIEREEIDSDKLQGISGICLDTRNPAGKITKEAWDKVKESVAREKKVKLRVNGEEDLLGIPAMHFAPKGSVIVYGLREKGSVLVEVNDEIKEKMLSFVDRRNFKKVVVGGSWEYLHPGHKYLLLTAFERGEKVSIGITSDDMLEKKAGGRGYKKYSQRLEGLMKFLRNFGFLQRSEIHKINDFKGNAVEEGDAIAVSEETSSNAQRINEIRGSKGKDPLEIIKIPIIKNDNGEVMSSSKRRKNR